MRIKDGLKGILDQLSRVNNAPNTEEDAVLEDAVLAAIASMCQQRIFSRIKSQRPDAQYTKTKTQFLGSVVQQALHAVHKHSKREEPNPDVERFTKYSQRLLRCLGTLETCEEKDVLSHIKDVLRAAHRFDKTANLDTVLQGISLSHLPPAVQKSLGTRLGKLARYRECSLYLSKIAKKSELFRETEVTVVSLNAQLFTRDLTVPADRCLVDCLSRCEDGAPRVFGASNIASKLKKLEISNSTFLKTVKAIVNDSSVHAEVQLVCHYELHPVAKKPRVICSSKDACYLCNLLIQLDGTFYIPGTHGNLYTRWRLPPIPSLDRMQAQLNKALEARIKELITNLMTAKTPRRMLSTNGNESTVFPFPTRLPTPASSVLLPEPEPRQASQPEPKSSPEPRPAPNQASEPDQASNPAPGSNPPPAKPDSPAAASPTQTTTPKPMPSSPPSRTRTVQAQTQTHPQLLLTRGQPVALRLENTTTTTTTTTTTIDLPSLTAGPITILPSCARTLASSSRSVIIQWLPRRQAAAVYVAPPRRGFVDIEVMQEAGVEVDIDSGSLEGVYLGYRGEVVMIEFVRAKPGENGVQVHVG